MSGSKKQQNRTDIERLHARGDEPLYIACEDLNFGWLGSEIDVVKKLWAAGKPIEVIAEAVRRIDEEVAILVMDLARKNQLNLRPSGVFGSKRAVS